MSQISSGNSSGQIRITAARVLFGYLAACAAGAAAMEFHLLVSSFGSGEFALFEIETVVGTIYIFGMMFLVTCVTALPGFAAMRFVLWKLGRTDWPSFAVAGALNASLLVILFFGPQTSSMELFMTYPPSPIFLPAGALAGAVACLTERHLSRRSVKQVEKT